MSFFWVIGDELALEKEIMEEGKSGIGENERGFWGVDVDFEFGEHFIVILEKG